MIAQRILSTLICLIILATSAFPQVMSQDEIEQAAEMMRQSGTPEQTIKQFLENMAQANASQEQMQSLQGQGLSEEEAAMRASGMDEEDISAITGLTGLLGKLDTASKAQRLKSEIAEFERTHGEKNNVSVGVGALVYELKLLECDYRGDTYSIIAEAAPKETGEKGESLSVVRSGPFAAGDNGQMSYIESLRFQSPEIEFLKDAIDFPFDGQSFRYVGKTNPTSRDEQPQSIEISFDCR